MKRYLSALPITIFGITGAASVAVAQNQTGQSALQRPNILHIVLDDVGYDDLSCYGSTDIKTPNMDALAAGGVRLTDFYAPHGTSTPSRATMLTGRYAPRVNGGKGLFVLFPHSKEGLEDEMEVTITELLKNQGYTTALFGKWHLGHLPQYLPCVHGFDKFLGIPYPNDHGPERVGNTGVRPNGVTTDPPIPLVDQAQIIKECDNNDLAELPALFTREACKFMHYAVKEKMPFYVQYSNIETHTPYFIPRGFEGRSSAKAFGDAVEYADVSVGILMDMIKRLGIEENTIVVITSDNGPLVNKDMELEKCYGRFGETDPNRKHILRGGKYQEKYDGGIRVPCIVNWKGRIPKGLVSGELVGSMDLFNLFADISGAEIPQNVVIDGKDVRPIIFGEAGAKSPHDAIYGFRAKGGLESVRFENWKLVINKSGEPSLYNLDNDLGESRDVASENKKIVDKMMKLGVDADNSIKSGAPIK